MGQNCSILPKVSLAGNLQNMTILHICAGWQPWNGAANIARMIMDEQRADGRIAMRDGAIRFFREFSRKIVQLSDGRCVYFTPVGSDSGDARMEVVTRLDAFGNADANLAEVTVVATHRRKNGIPPSTIRRPLTEVVEAVAKHQAAGFSPSTTESSIANASLERKGGRAAFTNYK